MVAGADRAVLRRAALPPLPAEPQPAPDQLRRPAARCRRAPRRPERLGARSSSPMAQALLYAGWIARASAGGGTGRCNPLRRRRSGCPRGRHEMVDLADSSPSSDDGRARRRAPVGAAPLARRDGRRRVHRRPRRRRRGGRHQRRRHDRPPAARPRWSRRDEAELLSAQLTVDVVDPVYEDALRAAAILLASARESAG